MKIILYKHGGSNNRGNEAIIRSSHEILKHLGNNEELLFSAHPEEDDEAGLSKIIEIKKSSICEIPQIPTCYRWLASAWRRLSGDESLYFKYIARPFIDYNFKGTLALHTGGDHYCYPGGEKMLAQYNCKIKKDGGISVLWGCSVEQSLLKPEVIQDMQTYDWITARESITYQALKDKGIDHVSLIPDPAFVLPMIETDFSAKVKVNTVGINISPYAKGNSNIGVENYRELIRWIQNNTNMDILFIPHVFKAHSNDPDALRALYDSLDDKSRITVITEKLGARELKAVISKCRFYVGARTHSTIAAYSTCIPTLVLGYSVKAKGIAKDIFGSFENYVVPVQELSDKNELSRKFQWMVEHENEIKQHLNKIMPEYRNKAFDGADVLKKFMVK